MKQLILVTISITIYRTIEALIQEKYNVEFVITHSLSMLIVWILLIVATMVFGIFFDISLLEFN